MITGIERQQRVTGEAFVLNPRMKSPRAEDFERRLSARIVDQERAVRHFSNLFQVFLAGMSPPDRPIGTMLFLGPTGSGKTRVVDVKGQALELFLGWGSRTQSAGVSKNRVSFKRGEQS